MKTFEQSCESVFVVKVEGDAEPKRVSEAQERHADMIAYVVNSPQAAMVTDIFYEIHHRAKMPVEAIIKNVFAQGVAVGLEMNREEVSPLVQ